MRALARTVQPRCAKTLYVYGIGRLLFQATLQPTTDGPRLQMLDPLDPGLEAPGLERLILDQRDMCRDKHCRAYILHIGMWAPALVMLW